MAVRNPNHQITREDYVSCVQSQLDFLAEHADGFPGEITAREKEDVLDSYDRGVSVDAAAKHLR